ncbi:MAG: hypothetical protein R3F14_10555, partial [Polyangiaceae bacterium]
MARGKHRVTPLLGVALVGLLSVSASAQLAPGSYQIHDYPREAEWNGTTFADVGEASQGVVHAPPRSSSSEYIELWELPEARPLLQEGHMLEIRPLAPARPGHAAGTPELVRPALTWTVQASEEEALESMTVAEMLTAPANCGGASVQIAEVVQCGDCAPGSADLSPTGWMIEWTDA